jgi:hypothetical protein
MRGETQSNHHFEPFRTGKEPNQTSHGEPKNDFYTTAVASVVSDSFHCFFIAGPNLG